MAYGIELKYDSHAMKNFLSRLETEQLPYATAKALTETAKQSQEAVRNGLAKSFVLRNTWTSKGIQYERAEKKDWPNAQATIGSRDEYMVKQEEGATVKPVNRLHAIPVSVRPSPTQPVPLGRRMKNLDISFDIPQGGRPKGSKNGAKSSPQPFFAIPKNGKTGIYQRVGDRGDGEEQYYYTPAKRAGFPDVRHEKFKMLYRLQDKPSKYTKREWLEKTVTAIAQANMQDNFERAMAEAMSDAK